jgi:hypothetical protein
LQNRLHFFKLAVFAVSGAIHEDVMVVIDVRVLVGVVFLAKIFVCLLDLAVCGILLESEKLQ